MSADEEILELTDEVPVKKRTDKLDQLLEILSQPSTWKGLILVLGVIGVDVDPEKMVQIAKAVGLLYGTIAVIADKN